MKSDKFSLSWWDAGKAIAIVVITAFIAAIGQPLEVAISSGDWAHLFPNKVQLIIAIKAALSAGIGYAVKNYFSDTVKGAEKTLDAAAVKEGYKGVFIQPVGSVKK